MKTTTAETICRQALTRKVFVADFGEDGRGECRMRLTSPLDYVDYDIECWHGYRWCREDVTDLPY